MSLEGEQSQSSVLGITTIDISRLFFDEFQVINHPYDHRTTINITNIA